MIFIHLTFVGFSPYLHVELWSCLWECAKWDYINRCRP